MEPGPSTDPDAEPEPDPAPQLTQPPSLPETPTWIVTRPDDLLLFAVTFYGFTRTPQPTSDGFAAFVAGDGAFLLLTLPPQAHQDQRLEESFVLPDVAAVSSLQEAGQSTIELAVAAGTVIPVTVTGVLAAIDGQPITAGRTAIEIPAGLVLAPVPAAAGETVTANHPTAPRCNGDTTALWETDLRAPSGLLAQPLRTTDALIDGPVGGGWPYSVGTTVGPLYPSQEALIVQAALSVQAGTAADPTSSAGLARVDRLRLSALGGTLTAQGSWTPSPQDTWPALTWQHDMALGRDRRVFVAQRGVLLPFGHTATLVEIAERKIEEFEGAGMALIRAWATLYIDPVRTFPDDELARQFPFDRVDVLVSTVDGLDPADPDPFDAQPQFTPARGGVPVEFPVRLFGTEGPVDVAMQLLFLGNRSYPVGAAATGEQTLDAPADDPVLFPPDGLTVPPVVVPAARVDLVRSAVPQPADVHVVHGISLATVLDAANGVPDLTSYRPTITSLQVALPALQAMLPPGADTVVQAVLSQDLISNGAQAATVLSQLTPLVDGVASGNDLAVAFSGAAAQSGALVNPSFTADTVARTLGPVKADLLNAVNGLPVVPDLATIFGDARLLGLKLTDLLSDSLEGLPLPAIVEGVRTAEEIASGKPPTATMSWTGLQLKSAGSFLSDVVTGTATLDLTATVGPDSSSVTCTLQNVNLVLPDVANALLKLRFTTLVFTAVKGSPPTLKAKGVKVDFGGALLLLEALADVADFGDAGQIVKAVADSITVSYALSLPPVPAVMFTLSNIDFRSSIAVPFTDTPVSVAISFASRDDPFTLAVLGFGGGGYIDLLLDGTGLQHFEGSLDFGAQLSVDFVVAAGEVYAFGGVSFTITQDDITVTAFLRFGGSLQVLGVVTVSIEVSIELTYDSEKNQLTGRATLVIEVDLTIWSGSVELDTGTWVLAGGSAQQSEARLDDSAQLAAWRQYRQASAA